MVIFVLFQIGRKIKKAAKQILSDFSVHEAENLGTDIKFKSQLIVSIILLIPGKCLTVLFKYHI